MDAEAIYLRLPPWVQNAVCSLQGWRIQRTRFGPQFEAALRAAEERWRWPAERLMAYRDERLARFVRHAYDTTTFYKRLFDEHGIDPASIRGLDDMHRLPVVTKPQVQAAGPEAMRSSAVSPGELSHIHTSGTTGGGLKFETTRGAAQEQWATWWRYWQLHGLRRGTWCGYFGGRSVVPPAQQKPPFWRINRPGRQILFSAYHMTPATIGLYFEELRRRRPPWLHGYPSILAMLAGFALETGARLGYDVERITTGAENLLPQQAAAIERVFGIAPIQHYGMAEAVANFSMCTRGRLHVDEDFAAVEFLPTPDGSACRVVGTNFTNPATPLVRYDVGDVVDVGDETCDCGLPGRVIRRVDGRREDYVVLLNGARLGRMDHVFKDMTAIREAQIYQKEPGAIVVRVVRNAGYGEADERMLLAEFYKRVGDQADVRIDYVDSIARTATGKLRFVVSELKEGQLAPETIDA